MCIQSRLNSSTGLGISDIRISLTTSHEHCGTEDYPKQFNAKTYSYKYEWNIIYELKAKHIRSLRHRLVELAFGIKMK